MLALNQPIRATLMVETARQIENADPSDEDAIALAYIGIDLCATARRDGADPILVHRLENAARRLRQLSVSNFPGMM